MKTPPAAAVTLLLLLLVLHVPAPARAQIYTADRTFGAKGTGAGQFDYAPRALALDAAGNLYACDHKRVHKFSPAGKPLLSFGMPGNGANGLDPQFSPSGVAVSPKGDAIFVTDAAANCIRRFDGKGRFQIAFGSYGTGPGQLKQPYGLALDRSGNLFALDSGNKRVLVFTANGQFLRAFGAGQLRAPKAIAIDPKGFVYVADRSADSVAVFAPDGRLARRLGDKSAAPAGGVRLYWPIGVGLDAQGRLHVLTDNKASVQILALPPGRDAHAKLTSRFGGLQAPSALAVNPATGDVFVSQGDQYRPRVVKYRRRYLAP